MQLRLQKADFDLHYKVLVAFLSQHLWMSVGFWGCKSKNCIPLEHFFSPFDTVEMPRFGSLSLVPGLL